MFSVDASVVPEDTSIALSAVMLNAPDPGFILIVPPFPNTNVEP